MDKKELQNLSQKELDDLVIDEMMYVASIVNNLGRDGQIQFLVNAGGGDDQETNNTTSRL